MVSHGLKKNLPILNEDEQSTGLLLIDCGQAQIFAAWPAPGSKDAAKRRLLNQARSLHLQYTGGLKTYVARATALLEASKANVNPYADTTISPPDGVRLETETKEGKARLDQLESMGLKEVGSTAFVLVAGGSGEKLGIQGVRVGLPAEISTGKSFLELYIQHVLALQARARKVSGEETVTIPLVIMASADTEAGIRALLEKHNNFGMEADQLTVVVQQRVPALSNSKAQFVLTGDKYELVTEPHGHGDIHTLLYQHGIAENWAKAGKRWVVMFQDNNPLAFRAIPAGLGVSSETKWALNFITVPRKPTDSLGAIVKVTPTKGKEKSPQTINVESYFMEQVLKGGKEEVDEKGFSKFPGNTNILIFDAQIYANELIKNKGVVPEFVNPKYKDKSRTSYKAPARLECNMQDFAKLIPPEHFVGYTTVDRWMAFAPVRNKLKEGLMRQSETGYSDTACTAEAELCAFFRRVLREALVNIENDPPDERVAGIIVKSGARVVLSPSMGCTQAEIRAKFDSSQAQNGKPVRLTARSTLVLEGEDIRLSGLDLDGALVVKAANGARVLIKDYKAHNAGWALLPNEDGKAEEQYLLRGYTLVKNDQVEVRYTKAGVYQLFKDCQQGKAVIRKVKKVEKQHSARAEKKDQEEEQDQQNQQEQQEEKQPAADGEVSQPEAQDSEVKAEDLEQKPADLAPAPAGSRPASRPASRPVSRPPSAGQQSARSAKQTPRQEAAAPAENDTSAAHASDDAAAAEAETSAAAPADADKKE